MRAVCRATVRLCVGGVLCDPLSHYVTLFQIGSGAPVRAALWGLVGPVCGGALRAHSALRPRWFCDRCARFGGARAVCRAGYTHTHHTHRSYTPHHNTRRGRRDELGRNGARRGSWRAGARGEARLALRDERGPLLRRAHFSGVKVPFHSAPAPVDGITPSRSSPSRYVPRSEGTRRALEAEVPVTGGRRVGRGGAEGGCKAARRRT